MVRGNEMVPARGCGDEYVAMKIEDGMEIERQGWTVVCESATVQVSGVEENGREMEMGSLMVGLQWWLWEWKMNRWVAAVDVRWKWRGGPVDGKMLSAWRRGSWRWYLELCCRSSGDGDEVESMDRGLGMNWWTADAVAPSGRWKWKIDMEVGKGPTLEGRW